MNAKKSRGPGGIAAACWLTPSLVALSSAPALGSPWTLPEGELVLSLGFNHQFAGQEFLDSGPARNFPLRGAYNASSFALGLRAGFTDRIEFEAVLPVSVVNYDSDPVILLERPAGTGFGELDFYQRNVIDLTRSVSGVADFIITGRYGWMRSPVAIATEVRVKAPTGYAPPAGTFGDRPTSSEAFLADVGRFVAPENVQDDVTLGDGQLDITPSMLFGWSLSSGTFFRLGAGFNFRMGDAGDQVVGDLRVGQTLGARALVYASVRGGYSVRRGKVIGISVAAIDPDLPATEYGGATNLLLRELTLDHDHIDVGAGFIVRLTDRLELNTGYERTVHGRNIAAVQSLSLSLAFRAEMGR